MLMVIHLSVLSIAAFESLALLMSSVPEGTHP